MWLGIVRADENDSRSVTGWTTCEGKRPVEWTNWFPVSETNNFPLKLLNYRANQISQEKQFLHAWVTIMERGSMFQATNIGQVHTFA